MSRSRRKTKISGWTTATSEKEDKQLANRRLRRIVKEKLKLGEAILPKLREVSDVWCFEKDGKAYHSDMEDKDLRK